MALGMPLAATKGYAAPEVARAYTRAHELCQQLGENPRLLSVLFGLCVFYWTRGKLGMGRELAGQCLRLAEHVQDPTLLLQSCALLGNVALFQGEPTLARAYLEQSIALYNS